MLSTPKRPRRPSGQYSFYISSRNLPISLQEAQNYLSQFGSDIKTSLAPPSNRIFCQFLVICSKPKSCLILLTIEHKIDEFQLLVVPQTSQCDLSLTQIKKNAFKLKSQAVKITNYSCELSTPERIQGLLISL